MIKKYQKIICLGIYFLIFIFVGFFCIEATNVYADPITTGSVAHNINLEVQYPPLIGSPSLNSIFRPTMPQYVTYLFNAGMAIGFSAVFLSLVIAGIMYLLSPAKPDLLGEAKDRIGGAISGLLILILTYLIITTINPQLSFFKFNKLPETPPQPAITKAPGVYFYKSSDCSDDKITPNTSSIKDFGDLKNKINSVGVVQNPDTKTAYMTILYDNKNLWGKCKYITTDDPNNPSQTCKPVSPFAASASIHTFDFKPNGDGIYFYRKSCFNDQPYSQVSDLVNHCNKASDGYLEIQNSDIVSAGGIYYKKLDELSFTGTAGGSCTVPEGQQDCVGYDQAGKCTQRSCPTLSGENISSIIVKENYLVLFVYIDSSNQWVSCQEFPTDSDVNKLGPRQIKWQNIRNNNVIDYGKVIPNYVVIFPIQK